MATSRPSLSVTSISTTPMVRPARRTEAVAVRILPPGRAQIVDAQIDGRDPAAHQDHQSEIAGHIDQAGDDPAMELPRPGMALELGRDGHVDHDLLARAVEGDGAHLQQMDEGRAVQHRLDPLEGHLFGGIGHGISTALPKTSRSINCLKGSRISARGRAQWMTGLTLPSATRRSSSRRSSSVQPLQPMMLNSKDQM